MKAIGIFFSCVIGLFLLIGLGFAGQELDLWGHKHYDPKYEDVRRETFEHSKAYNQGMIQELQNMQFEYIKADEAHKDALASIILHRTADYDEASLPDDLRKFVRKLKVDQEKSPVSAEPATKP
jgi:hypothetical protein